MLFKPKSYRYARTLFTLLTLSAVVLMQGCFWESDDPAPATYSIGGTISNLSGTGLVLQNNGGDNINATADGSFTFSNKLGNGATYAVTIATQPTGETCSVSNGSGTVSGANVNNVSVICDADPTGYYENNGTVTGPTPGITDLQGLVSGNRFMFISIAKGLLYDGTFTSITGQAFEATVKVYKDGLNPVSGTVTGNIIEGSKITGNITTGDNTVDGTFKLTYAQSNNQAADINRIERNLSINTLWQGLLNEATTYTYLEVKGNNDIVDNVPSTDGNFTNCKINGTITPVVGSSLYAVSVTITSCSYNGDYTGLAATQDETDTVLVMAFSTGVYSVASEFNAFVIP